MAEQLGVSRGQGVAWVIEAFQQVIPVVSDRYLREGVTREQLHETDGTMGYAPYLCHGVIGKGLNDCDRIFAILAKVGYDGWVLESLTFLQTCNIICLSDQQGRPSTKVCQGVG
jgi:hypothetical protein